MTNESLIRTEGERLFAEYLNGMGYTYEFERVFEGKKRIPDFTITRDGELFLFDAKDFDRLVPERGFSQFDPYFRIRQRIDDGREKFKEFKDYPCCVVLRNTGNAFVDIESPAIVLGAMYGDSGFTDPSSWGTALYLKTSRRSGKRSWVGARWYASRMSKTRHSAH